MDTIAIGAIHKINAAFRFVYKGNNTMDLEIYSPKAGWTIHKANQVATDEQMATIIGWEA